jgi:hypothetical protein
MWEMALTCNIHELSSHYLNASKPGRGPCNGDLSLKDAQRTFPPGGDPTEVVSWCRWQEICRSGADGLGCPGGLVGADEHPCSASGCGSEDEEGQNDK